MALRLEGTRGEVSCFDPKIDHFGGDFDDGCFERRGFLGRSETSNLRPPKVSNLCSPHNTGQFYHLWEAQILTWKMVKKDGKICQFGHTVSNLGEKSLNFVVQIIKVSGYWGI